MKAPKGAKYTLTTDYLQHILSPSETQHFNDSEMVYDLILRVLIDQQDPNQQLLTFTSAIQTVDNHFVDDFYLNDFDAHHNTTAS